LEFHNFTLLVLRFKFLDPAIGMSHFQILHTDLHSAARQGLLTTAHGTVQTPFFMPVGSGGAVKGITPQQLKETGTVVVLANAYHLMLRPGVDVIEKLAGLHRFMAWNGPILTDSGGYQIFSLSQLTRVDDDGIEFASHVDGKKIYLNAEIATEIQNRLAADIIMCLDQCTPFPVEALALKEAVERTVRWARRAKQAHLEKFEIRNSKFEIPLKAVVGAKPNQLLFAVVQGGTDQQLRGYCASELVKMDFDGYAIGGLSVGEGHENMIRTVTATSRVLPYDLPRYLMGVGTPADIIAAVAAGVDMFDCVLPTRNGRNAFAFTEAGPIRLRNSAHINDPRPIEPGCDCYCCGNFSRAALRHFFNTGEMLGPILTSLHNLRFYQRLMAEIRCTLKNNEFAAWAGEKLEKYRSFDVQKDNEGKIK
jgi:queuine tRNA-ribosyltransferase